MRSDFCASFCFCDALVVCRSVVCRGAIASLSRTGRCLLLFPEDTESLLEDAQPKSDTKIMQNRPESKFIFISW